MTTTAVPIPSWLVPLGLRLLRMMLAQILEELEQREQQANLQTVAHQVAAGSGIPAPGNLQPGAGRVGRAP